MYFELFDNTDVVQEKRNWAVKAFRHYNKNLLMYGKERIASVEMQHRYREMTDFLLAHPPTPTYEEYNLLCAVIYRLRGDFLHSKKMYEMVVVENFECLVWQLRQRCDAHYADFIVIKYTRKLMY